METSQIYDLKPFFNLPGDLQGKVFVIAGLNKFTLLRFCNKETRNKIDNAQTVWRAFCLHLNLAYCAPDTPCWQKLLIAQTLQIRNMKLPPELLACRVNDVVPVMIEGKIFALKKGFLKCIDDPKETNPEIINVPTDEAKLYSFGHEFFATHSSSKKEDNFIHLTTYDTMTLWHEKKPIRRVMVQGRYTVQDGFLVRLGSKPTVYKDYDDQIELDFFPLTARFKRKILAVPSETVYVGRMDNLAVTYIPKEGVIVYDFAKEQTIKIPFPKELAFHLKDKLTTQLSSDYLLIKDYNRRYWYMSLHKPEFQDFGPCQTEIEPQLVKNCVYYLEENNHTISCRNLLEGTRKKFACEDKRIISMCISGERLALLTIYKLFVFDTNNSNILFTIDLHNYQVMSIQSGIIYLTHMNGFTFYNLGTGELIGENKSGLGSISGNSIYVYQTSTLYNYLRVKPLTSPPPPVPYRGVIAPEVPPVKLSLFESMVSMFKRG